MGVQAGGIEVHQFDNPTDEARYKKLIAELRCLVCQNQNLADSNAELALDLRRKTYDLVRSGKTDEEIVNYMVERYGDFVLYRPPLNTTTALLWVGPFVILGIGVVVLLNLIRRRRRQAAEVMDETRLDRARALLEEEEPDK
jgi:cytochrome c-type biogenesis protein CcmH